MLRERNRFFADRSEAAQALLEKHPGGAVVLPGDTQ